jgi:ribonucleoside-diphosphate reductase alpha chain
MNLWAKVEASNAGEPGFIFSNDKDYGTNPCAEIALRPYQFCNLCEINATDVVDQADFNTRSKVASFLGTLQASYTDFHYLRDVWKKTTEKDALVGVGITGIASGKLDNIDLEEGAKAVKDENERVAKLLGIKKAARTTTVKPSGTSSLVLGSSSGIHAWHDNFYIRRIRVGKNESIYTYLALNHPELVEDDFFNPTQQAIISVPQAAPIGAKTRAESTFDLLERTRRFNMEWVRPGHRSGQNYNNVSVTINIKQGEWKQVGEWMWNNRNDYTAMSCLPEDLGSYKQTPYETITEEQYNEMVTHLHNIDLRNVVEMSDMTNLMDQAACAGGACEIV